MYKGKSGCIQAKWLNLGKNWCIRAEWLYLVKVVIRAKWLYSGKGYCIRAKWLHSVKRVCIREKKGCIRPKVVELGQTGCFWANEVVIGKEVVFG